MFEECSLTSIIDLFDFGIYRSGFQNYGAMGDSFIKKLLPYQPGMHIENQ